MFFFNDTATTEIYTLSLHDALPIFPVFSGLAKRARARARINPGDSIAILSDRVAARGLSSGARADVSTRPRSEEHTSELQSRQYLVCRLLLEKKKKL